MLVGYLKNLRSSALISSAWVQHYYLRLAGQSDEESCGPRQDLWVGRLQAERANFWAARTLRRARMASQVSTAGSSSARHSQFFRWGYCTNRPGLRSRRKAVLRAGPPAGLIGGPYRMDRRWSAYCCGRRFFASS
jgi:hypothetical protein